MTFWCSETSSTFMAGLNTFFPAQFWPVPAEENRLYPFAVSQSYSAEQPADALALPAPCCSPFACCSASHCSWAGAFLPHVLRICNAFELVGHLAFALPLWLHGRRSPWIPWSASRLHPGATLSFAHAEGAVTATVVHIATVSRPAHTPFVIVRTRSPIHPLLHTANNSQVIWVSTAYCRGNTRPHQGCTNIRSMYQYLAYRN